MAHSEALHFALIVYYVFVRVLAFNYDKDCQIRTNESISDINCEVKDGYLWDHKTFYKWINDSSVRNSRSDKFTLTIDCISNRNISLIRPIRVTGMLSLTVRNCYIKDYYDYDFSSEVKSTEMTLQKLVFENCYIEYRESVFNRNLINNTEEMLEQEKCLIPNTLHRYKLRKVSRIYSEEYQHVEHLRKPEGYYNIKRKLSRCHYADLKEIDISFGDPIEATIFVNELFENGIFSALEVLNLTNNNFKTVPNNLFTDYMYRFMPRLNKVDLSGNKLRHLSFLHTCKPFEPSVYVHSENLIIDLTNNKISEILKHDVEKLEKSEEGKYIVHIQNNPLKCTCGQHSFYDFVRDINKTRLPSYLYLKSMKCEDKSRTNSSVKLSEILFSEMCTEVSQKPETCPGKSVSDYAYILYCLIGGLMLMTVGAILIFKFRKRIYNIYKIKTTRNCRCPEEGKEYDAFISHCSRDERWVYDVLYPRLLAKSPDIRICLHQKDFIPGACISDNIINSVEKSRYTVLILSTNFIESDWCRMEFQEAFHQTLKHRRHLIVILMEDINFDSLDYDLRFFLRTYTYLKYSDSLFWQKLTQTLAKPTEVLYSGRQSKPDDSSRLLISQKKNFHQIQCFSK